MPLLEAPRGNRAFRRDSDVRIAAICGVVVLLVYLATHLLLLRRFPWFVDETIFASFAQTVEADPSQRFIALIDRKGLVISWLGALLIRIGIAPMDAMRLISIASGAVAAAASGWIVWRWRSAGSALAVAALVAFIPYSFVHASVGIYDPFIAAGSMVALGLQLELARRPRLDVSLLLGITLGLVLLAKPTGFLAVVLIPISLLVFDWSQANWRSQLVAWGLLVVVALFIALSMYALTRLSPLAYTPSPVKNHRTGGDLLHEPFQRWGTVAPQAWRALWGYLTPPGVVLAAWGAVRVFATKDRFGLVVVAWAGAAIVAVFLLTYAAYPRYGLQAVGPLCILMVVGAEDAWSRLRRRLSMRVAATAVVCLLVPALLLDLRVLVSPDDAPYPGLDRLQYVTTPSNVEPVRDVAQEILRRVPPTFPASTPEPKRTVAIVGGPAWLWPPRLVLEGPNPTNPPRFTLVDATSDHALVNGARFVIVDGVPPDWLDLASATEVRRGTRGGGGPTVVLYDRGA